MEENLKIVRLLEEIRDRIDLLIRYFIPKAESYSSIIMGFESEEDLEKFANICSDIALRDEGFRFDVNREMKEVCVTDDNKDKLHKRSMWLVKKTNISNIYYKIK